MKQFIDLARKTKKCCVKRVRRQLAEVYRNFAIANAVMSSEMMEKL